MTWGVKFPVDFRRGGDTTSGAIGKVISELDEIYSLLRRVRSFDSSSIPPDDPEENSFWLDTSLTPPQFKMYSGGQWRDDFAIPDAMTLGGHPIWDFVMKDQPEFDAPIPLCDAPAWKVDSDTYHVDWKKGSCSYLNLGERSSVSLLFSPPLNGWQNLTMVITRLYSGSVDLFFPGNVSFSVEGYSPPPHPGTDVISFVYSPLHGLYFVSAITYGHEVYHA